MIESEGYEKWKRSFQNSTYISPCGNWKLKMSMGGKMTKGAGYKARKGAELHRKDGDGWELMDFYESSDEAKAAAGYPKVKFTAGGRVLEAAGLDGKKILTDGGHV